ncbi:MAG: AraC family transcriptional regulator [Acidobacteria bacterium]|nr:AraC family transcriptional regulator [Acidobacteriota bacterium]
MENQTQDSLAVSFKCFVPAKPLSEFVDFFWYWQGHDAPYSKERVLPTGNANLVIRFENPRTSYSGISGARSRPVVIERTMRDELLGVRFKLGGAFPFVGIPMGELHNRSVTVADIWGEQTTSRLLSLLHEARTIDIKFQILERWLFAIANRPLQHHPAVGYAMKHFCAMPGSNSSAEMADIVGFSQRRFIELFRNEVGLTPKLFCRLQRFREVINTLRNLPALDWSELALSHGYFDQPHFIHDFRDFSGVTPGEYLNLRTQHINHIRIRD